MTVTEVNIEVRIPIAQRDGESLDRTRTEREQTERREQVGNVGVENGGPRFFVAGADRRERRRAVAQFLADAFADQHVGVDGHAERQHDTGDAGHGQRGLEDRQHGDAAAPG